MNKKVRPDPPKNSNERQVPQESPEELEKPKIPPRMKKKKGPERPAKPPHLRMPLSAVSPTPSQVPSQNATTRDKAQDQKKPLMNTTSATPSNNVTSKTSIANKFLSQYYSGPGSKREVLVAASKAGRDRPVERRQREPAKLLTPTSSPVKSDESNDSDAAWGRLHPRKTERSSVSTTRNPRHPVVLIPRGHPVLDIKNVWGASFMPYSMWVQKSGSGDPQLCGNSAWFGQVFVDPRGQVTHRSHHRSVGTHGDKPPKSSSTSGASAKARSSSVTRSGSLTSHGSTSSDSGNETFPKSVLKKHKRNANKTPIQKEKKNVTFNAFATVQLMEE